MPIRILSSTDVDALLDIPSLIGAMERVFEDLSRGMMHQPLRSIIEPPRATGVLGLMPCHRSGETPAFALKASCICPDNPQRGLDTHQGAVLVFDGVTGVPRAVVEASRITAARTAAVSALATRTLARPHPRVLGILGSGAQGASHLEVFGALGGYNAARVWSPNDERSEALARRASIRSPFPVVAVASAEEAVRGADVVVTATAAHDCVVRAAWLEPGVHINAVGAAIPTARELETAVIANAGLIVDWRESALTEAGDILIPIAEGAFGPDHIRAQLGDVLIGAAPGRTSEAEVTVFKSLGLAVEDFAAAELLVERAEARNIGTLLDW